MFGRKTKKDGAKKCHSKSTKSNVEASTESTKSCSTRGSDTKSCK